MRNHQINKKSNAGTGAGKVLLLPAACLIVLILILIKIYTSVTRNEILDLPFDTKNKLRVIAHGGGTINGLAQSNSYEAVMQSIQHNCKLIELDLMETRDGKFVATHDWGRLFHQISHKKTYANPPSLTEIMDSGKILGKYSILSESDIRTLLDRHEDILIFTDQTTNYKLINEIGHKDRLFVETFNIFDYIFAIHNNIKRPLLNMHDGKFWILPSLVGYLLTNPKYITVSIGTVEANPWLAKLMTDNGTQLFVFTVNDQLLAMRLFYEYHAAIYSDDLLHNCK